MVTSKEKTGVSKVQRFLDKLPFTDERMGDWLADKEAEYRMLRFSAKDAKEKALRDWHTYMEPNADSAHY